MSELENLKVGDKVIVSRSPYPSEVATVGRETKCYFEVDGDKYHKKGGRKAGGHGWNTQWIHAPEEGEIAKIESAQKHREVSAILGRVNWPFHPLEVLEKIQAIVNESVAAKQPTNGDRK